MSTAFPNEPTGATNLLDHAFNNFTGLTDVYSSVSGGTLSIQSDATGLVSPSNCMRSRLGANAPTGGCQLEFPMGGTYDDMFVGIVWRTNSQFQGRTVGNKLFFMRGPSTNGVWLFNNASLSGGAGQLIFAHNTGGLDNSHIFAADSGLIGYPNTDPGTLRVGQWFKLECYMKKSTTSTSRDGIVRSWVNGVLTHNYTTVNYPGGFNDWTWSETWDGFGDMGTVNTVEWQHFVDHLYVSTGGSGSGGGGVGVAEVEGVGERRRSYLRRPTCTQAE